MYDIYIMLKEGAKERAKEGAKEEGEDAFTTTQWSDDIENVLGKIRENCIMMSNYHKMRYYSFKSLLHLCTFKTQTF
jgi:hypothetical protein